MTKSNGEFFIATHDPYNMSTNSIESLRKKGGLLTDKSNEFAKLNQDDKLICLDIVYRNRQELNAWIIYTARNYRTNGVEINVDKFIDDIIKFEEYARLLDFPEDRNDVSGTSQ